MTTLETGLQIPDEGEVIGKHYEIEEVLRIPDAFRELDATKSYNMSNHAVCGTNETTNAANAIVLMAKDSHTKKKVGIKAYVGNRTEEGNEAPNVDIAMSEEQRVHQLMSKRAGGLVVPLLNVEQLHILGGVHTSSALITEWAKYGTYKSFECKTDKDVNKVLLMAARTAGALALLDDMGLVHGDVYEGNIACGTEGAQLMDFGSIAVAGRFYEKVEGRGGYIPNEVLETGISTHKRDIFALSVTSFKLLTGVLPYNHEGDTDPFMATQVATPVRNLDKKLHMISGEVLDMFKRGLNPDPYLRPHGREMASVLLSSLRS